VLHHLPINKLMTIRCSLFIFSCQTEVARSHGEVQLAKQQLEETRRALQAGSHSPHARPHSSSPQAGASASASASSAGGSVGSSRLALDPNDGQPGEETKLVTAPVHVPVVVAPVVDLDELRKIVRAELQGSQQVDSVPRVLLAVC